LNSIKLRLVKTISSPDVNGNAQIDVVKKHSNRVEGPGLEELRSRVIGGHIQAHHALNAF
jgi:hypothetical protein